MAKIDFSDFSDFVAVSRHSRLRLRRNGFRRRPRGYGGQDGGRAGEGGFALEIWGIR